MLPHGTSPERLRLISSGEQSCDNSAIETLLTDSRLALYDVVIYIDDSGSMAFEEQGERIKDLELIMQRVAFAATLFDEDGYGSHKFCHGNIALLTATAASRSVS